jgi:hypothetical protein
MAKQTRKERNREKRREWKSRINAWKSSGLTQVEYCRQKELSKCQFTYWKCKLEKKVDPITFVPIMGKPVRSQTPQNHQAPIKLIIDSMYQIEIGDGFSPGTLSTLIRTLDRL